MREYNICGIQQMGIGVTDIKEAWNWYIKYFGTDCKIFDDETEAKLMLPYTGGEPRSRRAILAINMQSGGGFEIWQYKGRTPLKIKEAIKLGDLGINFGKIKTKNIYEAFKFFSNNKNSVLSSPTEDPSGNKSFFVKDPFGNVFQIVEGDNWFMDEGKLTGGAYGAIIGVTDIEKSMTVYSDILGYKEIAYDVTGKFEDLKGLNGGEKEVRRVLLKNPAEFVGPFSKLFGQSEIELVSAVEGDVKKIYEGRFWGDPGFIHLCYDIQGMDKLREYCLSKGFPFTVDSNPDAGSFDMGEAAGHFSYIEDPDGTLIEFVETHKVPVIKKLGLYINIRKKEKGESLPSWIIKAMRFSKVKEAS